MRKMKDSCIGKLKTENGKVKDRVVIGVGCDGCDCRQQCSSQNRHCETASLTSLRAVVRLRGNPEKLKTAVLN